MSVVRHRPIKKEKINKQFSLYSHNENVIQGFLSAVYDRLTLMSVSWKLGKLLNLGHVMFTNSLSLKRHITA